MSKNTNQRALWERFEVSMKYEDSKKRRQMVGIIVTLILTAAILTILLLMGTQPQ